MRKRLFITSSAKFRAGAAARKRTKLILNALDMALWHYPRGLMAGLTGRPRSTVETPSSSARR